MSSNADVDKENPRNFPLKRKITGNVNKGKIVGSGEHQRLHCGVALQPGQKNFLVLKSKANERAADKENYQKKNGNNLTVAQLRQIEFSVYKDCNDNTEHKQAPAAGSEISSQDVEDEEFDCQMKRLRLSESHIQTEQTKNRKYDDNYHVEASSRSVSDVSSPSVISLDSSTSASVMVDARNLMEIVEQSDIGNKYPRNDRKRFYEVVEYQHNILQYFREREQKLRAKPQYMRYQTDITNSMRTILVDWLVSVSQEFDFYTETLYLSVSFVDRFLSRISVERKKLQLVGTTAIFIASKYEEMYAPQVAEFACITDDTYDKAAILRMEEVMLKVLGFELCTPTAYEFINTYAVLIDIPKKVKFLTMYLSELSLLEADPYLHFYPSLISAACLALARYRCDMIIWSSNLQEITSYRLENLKEVLTCLCKTHIAAGNLCQQAIQEKYNAEKFQRVSTIKPVVISGKQFDQIAKHFNEHENIKKKQ